MLYIYIYIYIYIYHISIYIYNIYIYIYIRVKTKKQKKLGVSAKTVMKQVANNGKYKKEVWQYRELGSPHGIVLGFLRGRGCSLVFIAK